MKARLKQVIEYKGYNTQTFEIKCSITHGVLHKFFRQNGTITMQNIQKIADTFPDINWHWLITGKGTMIYDNYIEPITTERSTNETLLKTIIDYKQQIIDELQKRIDNQDHYLKILTESYLETTQRIIKSSEETNRMLREVNSTINQQGNEKIHLT